MHKKRGFLIICLSLSMFSCIQAQILKGVVFNAETGETMPFVNVFEKNSVRQSTSDINGNFQFNLPVYPLHLKFTFVGFEPFEVVLSAQPENLLKIFMQPKQNMLDEVPVFPGLNPAHRIIQNAIDNRTRNNPYHKSEFKCMLYSKMYITGEFFTDSLALKKAVRDTTKTTAREFFDKQHLFMTETYAEKKYKKPGKESENIIRTRISGFSKAPLFLPISTNQSFSLYSDFIDLLQKKYVNPVSPGTFNRYSFVLADTLYDNQDSVFVIRYFPKKGRNFESLEGLLFIHSSTWAIEKFTGTATDKSGMILPSLEQIWEKQNGVWFPKEILTQWYYNTLQLTDSSISTTTYNFSETNQNKVKVVMKTFVIEADFSEGVSDNISFQFQVQAEKNFDEPDTSFWGKIRPVSLDSKERETYRIVDSVGKKKNLDRKVKFWEAMATGKIPLGKYFDFQFSEIAGFNEVEGFRTRGGFALSERRFPKIMLEAVGGYGFRDREIKYRGKAGMRFQSIHQFSFFFESGLETREPGLTQWNEAGGGVQVSQVRNYLISMLDYYRFNALGMSIRPLRPIRFSGFIREEIVNTSYPYLIPFSSTSSGFPEVALSGYANAYAHLELRFQPGEKFMRGKYGIQSLGSPWPALWIQLENAIPSTLLSPEGSGYFAYQRWSARVDLEKQFKTLGKTTLRVEGGTVLNPAPFGRLFIPYGAWQPYSFFAPGYFETMRLYEFAHDRQLQIFHTHDFGKLIRKRNFSPELVLVNNILFGEMKGRRNHQEIAIRSAEKGYFESGIRIHTLIKSQFFGLGVQALYRYGHYSLPELKENLSLKLTGKIIL
jgi:hypothetical protein